jgi:hypothetical protein
VTNVHGGFGRRRGTSAVSGLDAVPLLAHGTRNPLNV